MSNSPAQGASSTESASAEKDAAASQPNVCVRLSRGLDGSLQRAFYNLGMWIGKNPWYMIAISVIAALLMGSGIVALENEGRGQFLWTPKGSPALKNADKISAVFGVQPRSVNLYITAPTRGDNVLTGPRIRQTMLLVQRGNNVTATADHRGRGEQEYTYGDLCERKAAGNGDRLCVASTILDAWGGLDDFDAKAAAAGGIDSYDVPAYLARQAATGQLQDRFGVDMTLGSLLGGISRNAAGNITSAAAIQHSFQLRNDEYEVDGSAVDPAAEAWELAWDEAIGQGFGAGFQATLPDIHAVPVSSAGYSEAVGNFITGDLGLVGASVFIIVIYVFLQFSECSRVGSRATLAAAGIATVGLALLIGYGLGSITSFSTPVHSVLPFLLFGIGVDDVFVIAGSFSRTRAGDPIPLRIAQAMQHAGSSVLLTSVTDALAFGISATTSLPALSSFTLWALYGILGAFFMSCTFFVAVLTLDARRQEAGRYDCCCCFVDDEVLADVQAASARVKAERKAAKLAASTSALEAGGFAGSNPITATPTAEAKEEKTWGSKAEYVGTRPRKVFLCVQAGWMAEHIEYQLAPALTSIPGQVAVGLVFAGLLAASAVGVANLGLDFQEEWFVPADSYLQESFKIRDAYFSGNGFPVWAYAENFHPVDYPTLMPRLESALRDNKYVNTESAPLLSWYSAFQTFLAESAARNASGASGACGPGCPCYDTSISSADVPTNRADFDSAMDSFLCSPAFSFWGSNIVFQGGASATSGPIRMTRVQAFYSVIDNALDEADAMETTIDAVNKAGREAGIGEASVFAYTFVYREWEQYVVVPQEAITNVGLSIACVFVVVSLLLADLQTSILVTLVVGSCLLNILGFMHFWGVSLDGVSVVFLVLAVGLSIDYSAHIAHAFLHVHEETRKARVSKALGEMGVSVINGASSTFLAVVVLSPSASYIFSTLFRVFFLSSVLGAAHGLILLPVVLLWFGSEAHSDEAPDFEHDDEEDEEPAVAAKKPATQVELTPVAGAKSAPATVQDGKAGVAPPQQS